MGNNSDNMDGRVLVIRSIGNIESLKGYCMYDRRLVKDSIDIG